jgi:hypothetical protein
MEETWTTAEHRLWELGEEPVLHKDIELVGVAVSGESFTATLGGILPCPTLTEFQNGNTWAVTREGSDEFNEQDIILQLNGCELTELHLGSMNAVRVNDNQAIRVLVVVACARVWIK